MNKDKLLGQIEIIRDMTDNEGVKQLCYVLDEIVNGLDKKEMGFKDDNTDSVTHE